MDTISMKPLTILVAEDDLLARMVLERSVVQWGHQLVSAKDGTAAVEQLQAQEIDVCVLDWDMPKMTGIEVCRWLRAGHLKKTPYIVLVTSRDKPQEIQAGYEAGADDYLTKPCDLKYLRRRIDSVAERLNRKSEWMDQVADDKSKVNDIAGLSPLDLYLSDLRLMRRKT